MSLGNEGRGQDWQSALEDYNESLNQEDLAPGSRQAYSTWAAQLAKWAQSDDEDMALENCGQSALARYRDHRSAHSSASATADALRGAVRFFWPAGQKPPRAPRTQTLAPKWVEDVEADRLIREARREGGRDHALVALLLMGGLRISEALALRVSDVILRGDAGSFVAVKGKGQKQHKVPIPGPARDALKAWIREARLSSSNWLFPGGQGGHGGREGHLTRQAADAAVKKLATRAGIRENVGCHRLRHTGAHRMLSRGAGLEKVAAVLGHSNVNTTARYVAASESELTDAVRRAWE